MEITVLDANLNAIALVENIDSVIWNERYSGFGDFEIFAPITSMMFAVLQEDYYLRLKGSNKLMIIEYKKTEMTVEDGYKLVVKGRSLESILDRRVVWDNIAVTGSFQAIIFDLISSSMINSVDEDRIVDNLIFEVSDDPAIVELTYDLYAHGEFLYDVIKSACDSKHVGFEIYLSDDGLFVFRLYSGTDRSYNQLATPYVVFSPNYENVSHTEFISDKQLLKTVSLVLGSGEDDQQKIAVATIPSGGGTGLNRREMCTNATGLSESFDGSPIPPEEYTAQLIQKGQEDLAQNTHIKRFEGSIDPTGQFLYGRDFLMGDIVQVTDEFGNQGTSRVIEFIQSEGIDGYLGYPTFETIE